MNGPWSIIILKVGKAQLHNKDSTTNEYYDDYGDELSFQTNLDSFRIQLVFLNTVVQQRVSRSIDYLLRFSRLKSLFSMTLRNGFIISSSNNSIVLLELESSSPLIGTLWYIFGL